MEVFGEVSLEYGYFGSGGVVTNAGRVVQVGAFSVFVAAHCMGFAWVWWRYIGNTSPGDGFSSCNTQTAIKFGLLFRAIKMAEYIVNCRPLSKSQSKDGLPPLRPIDLMVGALDPTSNCFYPHCSSPQDLLRQDTDLLCVLLRRGGIDGASCTLSHSKADKNGLKCIEILKEAI